MNTVEKMSYWAETVVLLEQKKAWNQAKMFIQASIDLLEEGESAEDFMAEVNRQRKANNL